MSTKTSSLRRSQALVDREVQGGVLAKIAIHWVLLFFCNTMALMVWLRLFERPDVGWSETFAQCYDRFLPFFIISAALIPAFVWDTLKLTNRFAGPISRLRQSLQAASRGERVEPLHFRQSDYWSEIAGNFNALLRRKGLLGVDPDDPSADPVPPTSTSV